jgi:antibiotic biosynthesis monooxygenase (ABM) superfamily enzyme
MSNEKNPMKKLITTLLTVGLLAFAATTASAQTTPKSVIHVVTVKFKAEATPAQIKAALDGVVVLPAKYKGITRVWVKSIKVQGDKTHAFVMEFADEAALKAYADSPAQKEWYQTYLPIRDESTTFDITN